MPTAQNGSPRAGSPGSGLPRTAGIRDVARMAGVSVASASFALNGQPGVADDTRRRILAIAEQLGYRANPQAQALRRGRTTTYGFVVRATWPRCTVSWPPTSRSAGSTRAGPGPPPTATWSC